MDEIYTCTRCGQSVEGWHAAHEWFLGRCKDGSYQHNWVLVNVDSETLFCAYCGTEYTGFHICLERIQQDGEYRSKLEAILEAAVGLASKEVGFKELKAAIHAL
jgi:hypothetical protein